MDLMTILVVLGSVLALLGIALFVRSRSAGKEILPKAGTELISQPSDSRPTENTAAPVSEKVSSSPVIPVEAQKPIEGRENRLEEKLGKSRGSLFGRLSKFLDRKNEGDLSSKEWEEMEEILLEADVGVQTSMALLNATREKLKADKDKSLKEVMHGVGVGLFGGLNHGQVSLTNTAKPFVISIVGINGVGKTTTIGKLAQQFSNQGKTVLLAAADTFRAGAISQLKVWADRTQSQFVTGREGADPGAVAFDSVTAAVARKIDIVLLDTAGRLHTKSNLMEELKKIHRVVKKVIPEAPHETWLVIDGTLGQNSIVQAKEFQKALELTGVIITKLDGTAKGGAVLAIASELNLPIRYIGVGESVEDLTPFDPQPFVQALLGV